MQKKSNSIVFWRIIATYMVVIAHFDDCYYIFRDLGLRMAWHVIVDFFFMVSGYLLYSNLDKLTKTCKNGLDYFILRYKKVYPHYLGGFIVCFILYVQTSGERAIDVLVTHVFELLCLQGIGLDVGWVFVNNSMWYISVMLIAGFIVFHCLVKWKDNFVHFVAPIIVMVTFSYLYRYLGTINGVAETDGLFLNQALMRGVTGMCLGIFAVEINRWLQKERLDSVFVKILGVFCFLFVIIGSTKYGTSQMDYLFVLVLMVAVAIGFLPSKSGFFNSRWLQGWSNLTFSIYIIHYAFSQYVFGLHIPDANMELGDKFIYLGIYLLMVTVAAALLDFGVKMVKQLFAFIWSKTEKYIRTKA